jgi:iron complex outermembrane receptor protein
MDAGQRAIVLFPVPLARETAELRLTSNGNGPLKWVVGAFGFDEKQPSYGVVSADQSNPFGAGGTCDALNSTPNIPACGNYLPQFNLRTRSYAFFGQATWTPIDRLHITGGLRYSHDLKNYNGAYLCQVGGDGTQFLLNACQNPPIPIDDGKPQTLSKVNYKAGLSYDVTADLMLYANTSSGYRAGGSFISPFYPTYGPETIKAYEIGWKNQLFNHRLIVNVDAYRQNYQNYIFTYTVAGDIVPIQGVFVPFTSSQADNLGTVKITGADLTVAYMATRDDMFNVGLEWIETKIGKASLRCTATVATDNGPCAAVNFRSPEGLPLPNTPNWRLTGAYEHTFNLKSGATVAARVQSHWEAGRYMDIFQSPGTYQRAFTKTDLSLTYTAPDKAWNVGAWVQNVENRAVFANAGPYSGTLGQYYPSGYSVLYRAPRVWGVKAGAKFDDVKQAGALMRFGQGRTDLMAAPSHAAPSHHATSVPGWNTAYERRAVILLTLAFGLVGLDRWIIAPLAPAMLADLGVSAQDVNNLIAVLG